MIRAFIAWGPAAIGAVVLIWLSGVEQFPRSAWMAGHDKIVHFGLYLVLGSALAWGRQWTGVSIRHWRLLGLGFVYAMLHEWYQYFIPRRTPSVSDLTADVFGLTIGYSLLVGVWIAVARKRSPPPV